MTSQWIVRYLGCYFRWHGNIMAPDHPKMILGVHRDRMHESKVSLDGFTIRNSRFLHPSLEKSIFIATILKIPKLQDYLVLAVVVRELSKHQSASCLIVVFCIVRFASLSCYSSAKTRIRPVKSYQINESFCSITRCALLHIVYHFVVVSTRFQCPELQVHPLSLPRYQEFEPKPEPKPASESHFRFFNRIFPSRFCTRYHCTHPSDLQSRASPI